MSGNGISIILYPRSYNKRGAENLHSVRGVTSTGVEVNIKLRIDEKYIGKPYSPSIKEFARKDRGAKNPCLSSPTNSPENREGMLLFSRAEIDLSNKTNTPTYVAKWAVVLAADKMSPEPIIGLGRIDVRKQGAQMEKLKAQLHSLRSSGKHEKSKEIQTIKKELDDPRNFSFPAVLYMPERLIVQNDNLQKFSAACAQAVELNGQLGRVGGVLIRARDMNGNIVPNSFVELFQRFQGETQAFESGDSLMQHWLDSPHVELRQGDHFEAIPLLKINNGRHGNNYYGAPKNYEKILSTYFDQSGSPLVCQVAVRVTEYQDQSLTLVSRVFPLSAPIGECSRLNREGMVSGDTAVLPPDSEAGIRMVGLLSSPIQRDTDLMSVSGDKGWHGEFVKFDFVPVVDDVTPKIIGVIPNHEPTAQDIDPDTCTPPIDSGLIETGSDVLSEPDVVQVDAAEDPVSGTDLPPLGDHDVDDSQNRSVEESEEPSPEEEGSPDHKAEPSTNDRLLGPQTSPSNTSHESALDGDGQNEEGEENSPPGTISSHDETNSNSVSTDGKEPKEELTGLAAAIMRRRNKGA